MYFYFVHFKRVVKRCLGKKKKYFLNKTEKEKNREIAVDRNTQLEVDFCNGIPSHAVDDNLKDLFSPIGRQVMHQIDLIVSSSSRLQNQCGYHNPK